MGILYFAVVHGKTTRHQASVGWSTAMEMYTRANGREIRGMVRNSTTRDKTIV